MHEALVHCVGQLGLPVHYRTARFGQSEQNQVATKCDVTNTVGGSHYLQAVQLKCHFHNWVGLKIFGISLKCILFRNYIM